ncbi:MAG: cytochrome-c peroxidase [Pedosphaera sp.]|nr:cytochrome-c peroxidase [Pedosphaera sp.]
MFDHGASPPPPARNPVCELKRPEVRAPVPAVLLLLCASLLSWTAPSLASGFLDPSIDLPLSPLPAGLHSLMPVPVENPLTTAKIELGRKLFFDQSLSRDGTISCASCHRPDKAFTDGRALPVGVGGRRGRRNAPSLVNAGYGKAMFWDGRADTLEAQALHPLSDPLEMGNTLEAVLARVHEDRFYRKLSNAAFGTALMRSQQIAQALASFQRTLVAGNSPYDRYLLQRDDAALSDAARRGLTLFRGKARCAHCHEGPLFTDQKFHNTGVSWGKVPFDFGRFEHTGKDEDKGRFKTPSLRQLTDTAPYMHDGSVQTLEEVIEFYDRGGTANGNLDPSIKSLSLLRQEKADLLAFLRMLSTMER